VPAAPARRPGEANPQRWPSAAMAPFFYPGTASAADITTIAVRRPSAPALSALRAARTSGRAKKRTPRTVNAISFASLVFAAIGACNK